VVARTDISVYTDISVVIMEDLLDYTADLQRLARLVAEPHDQERLLEDALTSLAPVVPYDLAVIYRLSGEQLKVAAAVGKLASRRIRQLRLRSDALAPIAEALRDGKARAVDAHTHQEDGDPYDGVLDLMEGHACMVVPLRVAGHNVGVMTLDREVCTPYRDDAVRLAQMVGHLISLSLQLADQTALLNRYRRTLEARSEALDADIASRSASVNAVEDTQSEVMRGVVRAARQVAASDLPVLIQGETGTGKEVLSRAIHAWSDRVDGPFLSLNCAAIPQNLVESELFGHTRGAFSGADRDRAGRFLSAHGGTLLLDELGDMPLEAQAKLLRVLQEGTFEPVGSDAPVRVDVRVIAATHRDLLAAVRAGTFREDLYYRLAVFPLRLPPLRERLDDLPQLVGSLLGAEAQRGNRGPWTLSSAAMETLARHQWPGNIRELRNVLERATILQPSGVIEPAHLALQSAQASVTVTGFPTLAETERRYLEEALERTGGKIYGDDGAASLVGLKPSTLQSRLKKLGLR